MTQSDLQWQIGKELSVSNDADYNELFPKWYTMFSVKPEESLYFYLWRQAILYLIGKSLKAVDVQIGFDEIKHNQAFKNLTELLRIANSQIKGLDPTALVSEMTSVVGSNDYPDAVQRELEKYCNGTYY